MNESTSLLRAVTTLFGGTVLAQALPFLAAPWIARLYTPDQFAVFGTLMAVLGPLSVVAAARYELAVMLPARDEDSADLVRGALGITLLMGIFAYAAVLLFGSSTRIAAKLPGSDRIAWAAALLTLLTGCQLLMQQWLLRRRRFGAVARVKVVQAVCITLFSLLMGVWGVRDGLTWGYLAGWFVFVLATALYVKRLEPLPGALHEQRSREALRAHREWPLVNSWPAVINAVASGMATFYMVSYFDADVAGQHNFARQYVLVPVSMITASLGQVILVRCAERVRERKALMPELRTIMAFLLCGALVLLGVLWFAGEPLFMFFFGEQWKVAGTAARILAAGYAMQLVASPFGVVLVALGMVRLTIVFPLVFMGLLVALPVFKGIGAMRFMALLSGSEVIAYTVLLAVAYLAVRKYDSSLAA